MLNNETIIRICKDVLSLSEKDLRLGIDSITAYSENILGMEVANNNDILYSKQSLQLLMDLLRALPIPPRIVFISDSYIIFEWFPSKIFSTSHYEDIIKFVLEFYEYVENIPFCDMRVTPGCLNGDTKCRDEKELQEHKDAITDKISFCRDNFIYDDNIITINNLTDFDIDETLGGTVYMKF